MEATFFDKVIKFLTNLIEKNSIKNIKFTNHDIADIDFLLNTFCLLIRYESRDALNDENQIKEMFLKNKFFENSYHEDTNEYTKILSKYSQLRKLKDGEELELEKINKELSESERILFVKDNNVLKSYVLCNTTKSESRLATINDAPRGLYDLFKRVPGVEVKGITLRIPREIFISATNGNVNEDIETIIMRPENGKIKVWCENIVKTIDNFFEKGLVRIFDKDGEIELTEDLDYQYYMDNIRHNIAHFNIDDYAIPNCCFAKLIMLPNGQIMTISNHWYNVMFYRQLEHNVDHLKALYIPSRQTPLMFEEEIDSFVDSIKVLKIKIDKKIEAHAFRELVDEYIEKYKKLNNPKFSIEEYLSKIISKYYECEIVCKKITNDELIEKRIKKNKDFFEAAILLSNEKAIEFQDSLIKYFILRSYKYQEKDDLFKVDTRELIKMSQILMKDMADCYNNKKIPNRTCCMDIEYAILLCQLIIYNNLIRNNFVDRVKNTHIYSNLDLNYLNSEDGKFREFLKTFDMSKFEIRYANENSKNKNYHFVETLKDKMFVLRIIRNSISHNNFKFKISNSLNYKDVYLTLSSDVNPNVFVRVRIGDFLNLMNNDIFKDSPNEIKVVNSSELEEIIKEKLTIK